MATATARQALKKAAPRRTSAQPKAARPGSRGGRQKAAPKPLPIFSRAWRVAGALSILLLATLAAQLGRLPVELALAYPAMGLLSFGLYGLDKRRAAREAWRIPEGTLHVVDFSCGIAGGLLGQLLFRHKTSKLPFFIVSASLATLHVAALLLVFSPLGAVLFGAN